VLCLAAPACFGGPTSDWPPKSSGDSTSDDSPKSPIDDRGAGAADAGTLAPRIDAGAPTGAGSKPCVSSPADDGGADAGVGDPDARFGTDPDQPDPPDAGCR
jgi:hypothetical protein